uniref:GG11707 n=1 Tax=Drosophila erecta TaxID=7220 RepID=B3P1Y4_DROER
MEHGFGQSDSCALDHCYLSVVGPSVFASVPSGCNRCLSRRWHYWTRCQPGAAPSPTHWLGRSADMLILIDSKRLPEVQCKRDHQCLLTECRKSLDRRTAVGGRRTADRRTKQRTSAAEVRARSRSATSPAPAFYAMAPHGLPLPRRSRRWPRPELRRLRRSPRIESRLGSDCGATLVLVAGCSAYKSSLASSLPALMATPMGRQRRIISEGAESRSGRSLLLSRFWAHGADG